MDKELIPTDSSQYINEEELETSDVISLYKELLRLIERDLDEEASSKTRAGITIWGIVAAIAYSIATIFGEVRKLQEFPYNDVIIIFLAFFFFIHFSFALLKSFQGDVSIIKSGRLIPFNKTLYQVRGTLFLRSLISALCVFLIEMTDLQIELKVVSTVVISLFLLFCAFYFCISFIKKNAGSNPKFRLFGTAVTIAYVILTLILVILFGSRLPFPIGERVTVSYIIGSFLACIVFLIELLSDMFSSTHRVSELNDLRDDLIFLRLDDINVGLTRYRIIKEGKTLSDELADDYERLNYNLEEQEKMLIHQRILINKIYDCRPNRDDSPDIKDEKEEQARLFFDSFKVLKQQELKSIPALQLDIANFKDRLYKSANDSGDYRSGELIEKMLSSKVVALDEIARETAESKIIIERMLNDRSQFELPTKPKSVRKILPKGKKSDG